MNSAIGKHLQCPPARVVAVVLMLVLWLGVNVFAASPVLHHLVHRNSQQASHDCILNLISKGLMAPAEPSVLKVAPRVAVVCAPEGSPQAICSPTDVRLAPGRAPPTSFVPHQSLR